MKPDYVRAGCRFLALGAVAYFILGVAYYAIIIAANW